MAALDILMLGGKKMKSGYFVGEDKSELTTHCLETVLECIDERIPVLYINTEMSMKSAAWKLIYIMTGIDVLANGGTSGLNKDDENRVLQAIKTIKNAEFIGSYGSDGFDINNIEKICKKAIKENKVKHIVIDNVPSVDFFVVKTRLKNNIMVPFGVGFTLAKRGVKGSGITFHENL